jgi:hypothetical protein
MSTTSRVAGAVAAGYALGRFKKLRLAVLVATAMSSPKFRNAAVGMIQDRIPGGAVVGPLTKEVGGKLVTVGKTAATSIVASRIDTLSQSLAERSQNLRKDAPGGQARKSRADEAEDDREAEQPEDEYEEQEDEEAEEPTDEYEEQDEEAEEPTDEYEEQEDEEAEEPADEYEEPTDEYEEQDEEAEEPTDEYEEQDEEAEEPTDEYEEQEDEEAEEPTDEYEEQEASREEEPEEPVARSPRRRRSASPAGRRRG